MVDFKGGEVVIWNENREEFATGICIYINGKLLKYVCKGFLQSVNIQLNAWIRTMPLV
jgi:hypothetical protein